MIFFLHMKDLRLVNKFALYVRSKSFVKVVLRVK